MIRYGLALFISTTVVPMFTTVAAAQSSVERWVLEEELRIGDVDGPDALTRISALAVDAEGTLYLVHPMEARVRMYDATGRAVGTMGRQGEGPGEFRMPVHAGWIADTLWVVDVPGRRVSFWHEGVFVRDLRYAPPETDGPFPPTPMAALPGGAFLFGALPADAVARPGESGEGAVLWAEADGSGARRIASPRFTTAPSITSGGANISIAYQPFDDATLVRVVPGGERLIVVERPAARSRRVATFTVTALSPRGDTLFTRAIEYAPRRLTREILERVIELPDDRFATRFPSREAALRALREAMVRPDHIPPVSELVAGRDGTIWLRLEDTGEPTVEWLVLDEHGAEIARVDMPRGTRIEQADRRNVWAIETDDLEVMYLVRFGVRASTPDLSTYQNTISSPARRGPRAGAARSGSARP